MDDDQQFCLRWNNHQSTLISVFDTLLENETLVDCTLAAEGRFLKAHKVVLSACSPYFAKLLQEQYDKHPIFILKDVKFQELRAMMDYMYRGEVNISQDQLAALLKAAESLQIKGLSDNRGAPRQEQPLRSTMPVGKNSYTLEQTKRARMGPGAMEPQDVSGSREGSSSPSRRRRKVRRRSMENDVHDNSNSSINQQTQPSNANLAGVSAITAAALASQISAAGSSVVSPATIASAVVGSQQPGTTQLTTSVPKKTDSNKGTSDAMNTENLQAAGTGTTSGGVTTTANIDDEDSEQQHMSKTDPKSNHKQKSKDGSTISTGDMTIEPKSEYDEEGNEESVEDLTLDEEMGMEDLDHNAGTSQGGEGSSQGYAWQHDRSQDELLLTTQDAQQRDPQDLSITRIAGLSWNEWNARLAMPLVTSLREGVHPLVFPTDLSIEKQQQLQQQLSSAAAAAAVATAAAASSSTPSASTSSTTTSNNKIEKNKDSSAPPTSVVTTPSASGVTKTPKKDTTTTTTSPPSPTPSDFNEGTNLTASSPRNCSSENKSKSNRNSEVKLKYLTEEEATALMLKAAAEKANNSGNISDDASYGDENLSSSGAGGHSGNDTGSRHNDYRSALTGAGAFADVGSAAAAAAAGLCNINILNSISAMNSLISGSSGNGSAVGSGSSLANALSRAGAGGVGSGGSEAGRVSNSGNNLSSGEGTIGGIGHPCPECGRVYKLKSSLRNHQKWECGKEPQFQCPFCVYRAKQKMHIGRHMERMHKEKFIKFDDIKSFPASSGGVAGDDSNSAAVAAVAAAAAAAGSLAAELRQHFS